MPNYLFRTPDGIINKEITLPFSSDITDRISDAIEYFNNAPLTLESINHSPENVQRGVALARMYELIHPKTGIIATRVYDNVGIIFKGTGYYCTDNKPILAPQISV